jgi:hypothetical protein
MRNSHFLSAALGVAWRVLHNVFTNPSYLIPQIVFPLFFFTAFAGGLSQLTEVPGFDEEYPAGYTSFQFVFVFLQSAAFGGVFTGFGIARDFESGFTRRLFVAVPRRSAIIFGYSMAALVRWAVTGLMLFTVGLIAGMEIGRRRHAPTHDAGGAGDAAARVPDPLLRTGLRPAGPARGLDGSGRLDQPGDGAARGRARLRVGRACEHVRRVRRGRGTGCRRRALGGPGLA